jgi:hypothetical protein
MNRLGDLSDPDIAVAGHVGEDSSAWVKLFQGCADCQADRGHGSGPYPVMTRAEMRAGLDLLPTWALEQKAAANRHLIMVMRRRLAAGEEVARMYQEPGLAWLERQAEVAEDLVAERQAASKPHR